MAQLYTSYTKAQQQLAELEAIDYYFAKEMVNALVFTPQRSFSDEQILALFHTFIALSMSLRAGHTCLPVTELAQRNWASAFDEQGICTHQGFTFPNIDTLSLTLIDLSIDANAQQPLVFENNNLYMRRYYQFEAELAHNIKARLLSNSVVSEEKITAIIEQLFPVEQETSAQSGDNDEVSLDWQKIAVANAINKNFTVIAGGPGTGKTYTVTKLLAALIMLTANNNAQKVELNNTLDIALVAPTGKAAQRLSESIMKAISGFKGLIAENILTLMPTQAKTIHRLLGVIPNSPNFRHHQDNQLSCDVLLVDEVSMVDLPMMTRLFRALKPDTKIILLGDADQLPSVAVGSVLADIAPRPHGGYSKENLDYLTNVCKLAPNQLKKTFNQAKNTRAKNGNSNTCHTHDYVSFLTKSRRFDGDGGIGKLASYVIQGQASESWQLLKNSSGSELATSDVINQLKLVDHDLSSHLSPLVTQYYKGIAQCSDIDQAFSLLAKFRVLCVTRQGEFGVDAINLWIKEQIISRYELAQSAYHGMPIMISENDYRLGLFNGDIGLLWRSEAGHLMAFFESTNQITDKEAIAQEGQLTPKHYKVLLPSRLPKYDSVYAMTIHKTQGSEFEHVAMILPKQAEHQLLSRELLYTGITRAKEALTIVSNSQTWHRGVEIAVKRHSGLTI